MAALSIMNIFWVPYIFSCGTIEVSSLLDCELPAAVRKSFGWLQAARSSESYISAFSAPLGIRNIRAPWRNGTLPVL